MGSLLLGPASVGKSGLRPGQPRSFRIEFEALGGLGFDLGLTGFSGDEITGRMNIGSKGLTDPDEVPETPLVPVSRLGDLWLLGSPVSSAATARTRPMSRRSSAASVRT